MTLYDNRILYYSDKNLSMSLSIGHCNQTTDIELEILDVHYFEEAKTIIYEYVTVTRSTVLMKSF